MLDGLDLLIPALDFSLVSFPDLMGTGEVGLIGSPCSSPLYDPVLHMTRVGTIPVDLRVSDLNVEQRNNMVIRNRLMIVP